MDLDSVLTINIQPIFNADTMTVDYAEVLLRPTKVKVGVEKIVGAFEAYNKSLYLDKFVLNKACEFIKNNPDLNVRLSVNLSRRTLEQDGAHIEILEILKRNGVSTARIILELHEETNFHNVNVLENVKRLSRKSVDVAIDDFGTGNTSLQSISKMDAKMVKFDRVFLEKLGERESRVIANIINNMHSLGIDTVIEGVETHEQLEAVKRIGYGNIQGFVLGRPVSTESYKELYS